MNGDQIRTWKETMVTNHSIHLQILMSAQTICVKTGDNRPKFEPGIYARRM
jgi:protein associated with RNAse G/E